MILVFTLLGWELTSVMTMIFSGLLVLLWTWRKSAHCSAAEGQEPSGIKDRKHCDRDYELLMTSQSEISLLHMMKYKRPQIPRKSLLNAYPRRGRRTYFLRSFTITMTSTTTSRMPISDHEYIPPGIDPIIPPIFNTSPLWV